MEVLGPIDNILYIISDNMVCIKDIGFLLRCIDMGMFDNAPYRDHPLYHCIDTADPLDKGEVEITATKQSIHMDHIFQYQTHPVPLFRKVFTFS